MIRMMMIMMMMMIFSGSVSGFTNIKVQLNHNATLPCSGRCSGSVRWREFSSRVPVAECDQTSCSSLREGFMMSHDQYLSGDLSLIITGADYRKRKLYTCNCDGSDLCDATLDIKPSEFSVQVKPGGSLIINIPILEAVKVEFNRTDGVSTTIWKNRKHKTEPHDDYKDRLFFNCSLHLYHLKNSDSGDYTVWDIDHDVLISTYILTVTEKETSDQRIDPNKELEQCPQSGVPWWGFVLIVLVVVLLMGSVVMNIWYRRKIHHLQTNPAEQQRNNVPLI